MNDNRNTILAVILSGLVLIAWQYFYNVPQMEKQRAAQQAQSEMAKPAPPGRKHDDPVDRATDRCSTGTVGQRARPAGLHGARRQPRYRHRRNAPRQDRYPAPDRQHLAERRAHRRSVAGAVPRDRRPGVARDRAVLALGHRQPLLCRIRLGRRQRLDGENSRPEHRVAAGRHRQPDARHPGDAEI